jgi:hypothetical protein
VKTALNSTRFYLLRPTISLGTQGSVSLAATVFFYQPSGYKPNEIKILPPDGSVRPIERTLGTSRQYQNNQSSFRHNGPGEPTSSLAI